MIHPSSIVDPKAEIGKDVVIGPWCTVGPHVKIGDRTRLTSHVVIDGHTTIGSDNVFFPFSVIGAVPQDLKYKDEPTQVIIGNNNRIRESVTINLGTVQGGNITSIGDENLLMAYSHLGHDTRVGNHCIIANGAAVAGHVMIDDYAIISGLCGVNQFVRIGAHTYIGGMSAVEKDIPPFTIVVGARPCQIRGANIVGLRRRGFSAELITKINEAIKLWSRSETPKEQCLLEIESQYSEIKEIQQFLKFIRESEAGVVK